MNENRHILAQAIARISTGIRHHWIWCVALLLIAITGHRAMFASVTVSTQPVAVGEVVAEVLGTGTLEAHHQTTVGAKIQGLIAELHADQNDWVKNGQLLARLDDSDLKREVAVQEALLNAAEATVDRAKADEARSKAIFDQARRDYDRYAGLLVYTNACGTFVIGREHESDDRRESRNAPEKDRGCSSCLWAGRPSETDARMRKDIFRKGGP